MGFGSIIEEKKTSFNEWPTNDINNDLLLKSLLQDTQNSLLDISSVSQKKGESPFSSTLDSFSQ